jgi:hypothetical protein
MLAALGISETDTQWLYYEHKVVVLTDKSLLFII